MKLMEPYDNAQLHNIRVHDWDFIRERTQPTRFLVICMGIGEETIGAIVSLYARWLM